MGPVGQVGDAPEVIQDLIIKSETTLYRVYRECQDVGRSDVVLDMVLTDPLTLRVKVSAIERARFLSILHRTDPTNPFIDRLSRGLAGRGFWVSLRVHDAETHYLYPLLLSRHQN